jgi:hypothetical protein
VAKLIQAAAAAQTVMTTLPGCDGLDDATHWSDPTSARFPLLRRSVLPDVPPI